MQESSKQNIHFTEINVSQLDNTTSDFGITVLHQTNANLLYAVPKDSFAVKIYRKSFRLFNFHSIEPTISDPDYTLSLVSENILNTLESDLSFTYDRAEKYKEISFDATYSGWFPFLSAGVNYLIDRSILYRQNVVRFNQFEPFAGFNIPLDFSKQRSFTNLNFGSQYIYSQGIFPGNYKDTLRSTYSYINNFLSFCHQIQQAQQQIFPRFAQTISFSYKTA